MLELFQSSGDAAWLAWAIELQSRQDALFWDPIGHGWFSTTGTDASVLVRMKEEYDGAEPSASAIGAWNLLTLGHLTGDASYLTRAREVFAAFGGRLSSQGRGLPMLAAALSRLLAAPEQIVVIGPRADAATKALWTAAQVDYRPFATFILLEPGDAAGRGRTTAAVDRDDGDQGWAAHGVRVSRLRLRRADNRPGRSSRASDD